MAKLELMDITMTGKPAQELENKLRRLVVGQDAAIHEIVRAYQSHMTGLSPSGRPIGDFCFWGRLDPEKCGLWRRRPNRC